MSSPDTFDNLIDDLKKKYPHQSEFLQAVAGICKDVIPIFETNENYKLANVLNRLVEPERIISFRVDWMNDKNEIETNLGYRVQFNGLIGPYKGGLRFHPSVNLSVLKFLAFEQCFKNALTGLPMGGAKGGADFDPRGRSDGEIMRFCQAFMQQLFRHIGPYTDVPAGDINVGAREIGYLYGAYRRLTNEFGGSLTGKGIEFGGSHVRTEATGFGLVYFLERVLKEHGQTLENKRVCVSGAGNVALHAAMRAMQLDAKVMTLSNSRGTLLAEQGLEGQDIDWLIKHHNDYDNPLAYFVEKYISDGRCVWLAKQKPWSLDLKTEIALPCATQNELDENDANALAQQGCKYVLEGANMPCTAKAEAIFKAHRINHVPGKASNAGGVAVSGLEMSQNADFSRRSFSELDNALRQIMYDIHDKCVKEGKEGDFVDYDKGANISAFRILADAMVAQGA